MIKRSSDKKKMGLFDKESISSAFGKAKKMADKAAEVAKTGIDQTKNVVNEKVEQHKQNKQPQAGGLIRYEVTYLGGHPNFQLGKKKSPYILLDVMPDRFSFLPELQSEDWFTGFDISYDSILELHIEKRTITTAEILLGAGDNANQEQENVICIVFKAETGQELTVRVEMLTGLTIFNQAKKCRELMALLRQHGILQKIEQKKITNNSPNNIGNDVLSQIERLASLRDAGILTEEEFRDKKKALLEKI